MTDQTQTTTEPVLLPCPFCGASLRMKSGVNAYGHCETTGCFANRAQIVPLDDAAQVAAWNRRPALSPPAEGIGMAANEVGAWIAKRDSEYEAALADLTQPPCIDSLDDFGRTIYSALEDCPAMSVDKQADFIARAFWPLISTPTPAPVELNTSAGPVNETAKSEHVAVDWERVGPKLVEAGREMLALVLVKYGNLDADVNAAVSRAQTALAAAQPGDRT